VDAKVLRELLPNVLLNEPMANHTTFGIGGPADALLLANCQDELRAAVQAALDNKVPYLLLGSGANVLVSDRGVRGLVIGNRCAHVQLTEDADGQPLLTSESGALLRDVAHWAIERGLSGLEWAVDVPGTVGGAVVGNAGAFGGYVSDNLRSITIWSPAEGERVCLASELGLGYRTSAFKSCKKAAQAAAHACRECKTAGSDPVIMSATFALARDDVQRVRERAADFTRQRQESQPEGRSAGSIFKRTAQYPAGFLIENANLKGRRLGDAIVSEKHANFIINLGHARASDVQKLISVVQAEVQRQFDVALELEIELVGEW